MSQKATAKIQSILQEVFPEHQKSEFPEELVSDLQKALGELNEDQYLDAVEKQGANWGYQPKHETSTQIITSLVKILMGKQEIKGLDQVDEMVRLAKEGYSVTIISNHLSYGDCNYLQAQLRLHNCAELPLMVMAGPKVYQDTFRKMSSMCFETLKMAQPPSRASDGADVSMRELAEITRQIIQEAEDWMQKGRVLLFFPEGSRSRTGDLQRFVAASARYCSFDKTVVFPVGFAGTEGLLSLQDGKIHFEDIEVSIGNPIFFSEVEPVLPSTPSQKRKVWMDVLGFAVAHEVPQELWGVYNLEKQDEEDLELARQAYLTIRKG